jgi:hypothetical protein
MNATYGDEMQICWTILKGLHSAYVQAVELGQDRRASDVLASLAYYQARFDRLRAESR